MISDSAACQVLLIDANVLVLYVVGSVNPSRIEKFKRTSKYERWDFDLLRGVMKEFERLCTVPQVWAEVSNLTDLSGSELLQARNVLRNSIHVFSEFPVPSTIAADDPFFTRLGITDAAIGHAARACRGTVLTDDLALYVELAEAAVPVINFTHRRAQDVASRPSRAIQRRRRNPWIDPR